MQEEIKIFPTINLSYDYIIKLFYLKFNYSGVQNEKNRSTNISIQFTAFGSRAKDQRSIFKTYSRKRSYGYSS